MLLSFASDGAKDTPAILLRRATPESAAQLRNAVEPLMAGISRKMLFNEIATLSSSPGFLFSGVPGSAAGVRQLGPQDFVWEETLSGWLRVYDLLEPFTMPGGDGVRWQKLQSAGEIAVIISTGDTW